MKARRQAMEVFMRHLLRLLAVSLISHTAVAAPPTFTYLPLGIGTGAGSPLSLDLSASDADGDPVFVAVETLPAWAKATVDTAGNAPVLVQTLLDLDAASTTLYDLESDRRGGVYASVRNGGKYQILKVEGNGTVKVVATGDFMPDYLAVAPDGTLYTGGLLLSAAGLETRVYKISNNQPVLVAGALTDQLRNMKVDPSGNVILLMVNTRGDTAQLLKVTPGGATSVLAGDPVLRTFVTHLFPNLDLTQTGDLHIKNSAMTIDNGGFIYLQDVAGNIRRISPTGGPSTISPIVPGYVLNHLDSNLRGGFYFGNNYGIGYTPNTTGSPRTIAGDPRQIDLPEPERISQSRDGVGTQGRVLGARFTTLGPEGNLFFAEVAGGRLKLRVLKRSATSIALTPSVSNIGARETLVVSARDQDNVVTASVMLSVLNKWNLQGSLLTDTTLAPGIEISRGVLGGVITGDATRPALIRDSTILSGSRLTNAILGAGLTLRSQVTFNNASFENASAIPPGYSVNDMLGYVPELSGADDIVNVDATVLVSGETVLEQIRQMNPAFLVPGALRFDPDGRLVYRSAGNQFNFEPVNVTGANTKSSSFTPGVGRDHLGYTTLTTPSGYVVTLRPVLENLLSMALTLQAKGLVLATDMTGTYFANAGFGGRPVTVVRPDPLSLPALAGQIPGIHAEPHPQYPGYSVLLQVYYTATGYRRQYLYPTPYNLDLVEKTLRIVRRGAFISLEQDGTLYIKTEAGELKHLIPAFDLHATTEDKLDFRDVGDLNGDGRSDFRVVHPAPLGGIYQDMYSLEK